MLIKISNPNDRKKVEEYLQAKNKFKNILKEEDNNKVDVEQNRVELFKPIIESNEKIYNELKEDKNKMIDTLNRLKIQDKQPEKTNEKETIEQSVKKTGVIEVGNIIAKYLKDNKDRSNARYSITHDNKTDLYKIGDLVVNIHNNNLEIGGKNYDSTLGLMELLTKTKPNLILITDTDKESYKQILLDSNGHHKKDSKDWASDRSDKWKFIKDELKLTEKNKTGSSIGKKVLPLKETLLQQFPVEILPSDVNSLMKMLQLSIASYRAGNKSEFNKINYILDELLRKRAIKKHDLIEFYKILK